MFRDLLTRLFDEDYQPGQRIGAEDGEIAIAALLIRVARVDDRYSATEQQRIDAILAARRRLSPVEAAERRLAAEMIEAEAPDTASLIRSIKARIALDDRVEVVAALWDLTRVDGRCSPEEEAAVQLAASLLGVNEGDTTRTRRMIEGELDPETP